jgi:hypothetical protein
MKRFFRYLSRWIFRKGVESKRVRIARGKWVRANMQDSWTAADD